MIKFIFSYYFVAFFIFLLIIPHAGLCVTNSSDIVILQKRASLGNPVDQYLYGRTLILGGSSINKKKEGILFLKKAASKGYRPAILFLAQMYEKGLGGIKRNYKEAYEWYKKGKDMGIKVAQLKLAPLCDTSNEKNQFRLFGIDLKKARRFCLRYALETHGAVPISLKDSSHCDIFDSTKLVPGTDRVQVCYGLDGKFILLEYRYPPRRRGYEQILASMLSKLKKKYGDPKVIKRNNLVDEYFWEKKGIYIYFWMEPKTDTCFLRYVEPKGYRKLYDFIKAKNPKKQISKTNFF